VANMRRACMVAPKYIGLLEVATADSELAGSTYTRDLPPIMGIIGALRVLPGTSRNDRGELTIHGGRTAWFACSTLAVMLPGRSRHAAEGRRSAPPTGHGRCCPVTVSVAVCELAALMRTGARLSA